MAWQPRTKQKRKCPRCGQSYFVMEAAGPLGGSAASLNDGVSCPKCRKLAAKPLTRHRGEQLPPGPGK